MEPKFDIRGDELEVVQKLEDGSFLVRSVYEGDSDDSYLGEAWVTKQVFDAPPRKKQVESIARLNGEIEQLTEKKGALQVEIRSAGQEFEALAARLARAPALKNIESFMDGKITHYVFVDYGEYTIVEFKDAFSGGIDRNGDNPFDAQKLLTLYGLSSGNFEWRLSQYRGDSGCQHTVIPCIGIDGVRSAVKKHLGAKMKEMAETKRYTWGEKLIEAANLYGVDVPAEIVATVKNENEKAVAKKLKKAQDELAKVEKEVEALGITKG